MVMVEDQVAVAPNKGKSHLDEETKLQIIQLSTQGIKACDIALLIDKGKSAVYNFLNFWRVENKLKKTKHEEEKIFLVNMIKDKLVERLNSIDLPLSKRFGPKCCT